STWAGRGVRAPILPARPGSGPALPQPPGAVLICGHRPPFPPGHGGPLMKTAIVIPARYASQRLPGKPLLRQTGKYLIQHVHERACQSRRAGQVVVATDDPRIVAAVEGFGGRAVLTRRDHASGTDRVAAVAQQLDADIVVNPEGAARLVDPSALDLLPDLLRRDPGADMATLATPIVSEEQWRDPNCVKVVCDAAGRALYFSRSPIPCVRDGRPDFTAR